MKKLSFLLAIVAVITCFSVTVFASNEAPFTFATDNIDVELGEGTENVDVTLSIEFDTEVSVGAIQTTFVTDGLEVVAVNTDSVNTYLPLSNDYSDVASGFIMNMNADASAATIPAKTKLDIIATLAVDKSVEKVYNIGLTESFITTADFGGSINDGVTYPSMTITVAAPAADDEPKTVEGEKVTSEVNEVRIGDAVYTNVAIFTATLGTGEGNYSEAGFIWVKDGNKTDNKYTVDASVIAGGGEKTYTAAMFAIADGVKIEAIPYYVTAE